MGSKTVTLFQPAILDAQSIHSPAFQNLPPASIWTPTWPAVALSSHKPLSLWISICSCHARWGHIGRPINTDLGCFCPQPVSHFQLGITTLRQSLSWAMNQNGCETWRHSVLPAPGAVAGQSKHGGGREKSTAAPRGLTWAPRNQPSGLPAVLGSSHYPTGGGPSPDRPWHLTMSVGVVGNLLSPP